MKRDRPETKNNQVDVLNGAVLFILALISRSLFQSKYLYHWDSVNFALSLEHYDVRLHQPHPPGYFLYSMLGKLFNLVFQEANTSLVWLSTLSGALGVLVIYFMAKGIFNRRTAVLASLFTLSSPLHWFISEVALSYALEFVFVSLLVWLAYKQIVDEKKALGSVCFFIRCSRRNSPE